MSVLFISTFTVFLCKITPLPVSFCSKFFFLILCLNEAIREMGRGIKNVQIQPSCGKGNAPVMENVERRSCLSAANFPDLPVLGTPPAHTRDRFWRRETRGRRTGKERRVSS